MVSHDVGRCAQIARRAAAPGVGPAARAGRGLILAWIGLWLTTLLVAAPLRAELEPAPPGLDATQIAERADAQLRSGSTVFRGVMRIESPRLTQAREVAFSSWEDSDGDRSFIRIREPAKDAGTGFLKLHPNLWMYVPRVERTMRIPPSMMLQSWMGSDFTNDDLVRSSSEVDDYDHLLLGVESSLESSGGRRCYVVQYTPHEDAPVVWGKIVAWIDAERLTPLRQEFYDEGGEKLRVMHFGDVREVEGRFMPHRWRLEPLDKPGHETEIKVEHISFDAEIEDAVFTQRHLQRSSRGGRR